MKLMRRAPREVYRVYAEEEFLAGPEGGVLGLADEDPAADAEEGHLGDADHLDGFGPPRRRAATGAARPSGDTSGPGERRLRRAAGAAMLIGAVAAFVLVLALNGLLSATDRRSDGAAQRIVDGPLAAAGQAAGSHGGAPVSHRQSPRASLSLQSRAQSIYAGRRTPTGLELGRGPSRSRSPSAHRYLIVIDTPTSIDVGRLTASARAGSQPAEDAEFGFER
jgi:hypothetical protein